MDYFWRIYINSFNSIFLKRVKTELECLKIYGKLKLSMVKLQKFNFTLIHILSIQYWKSTYCQYLINFYFVGYDGAPRRSCFILETQEDQ